jgi:hypothetical protein
MKKKKKEKNIRKKKRRRKIILHTYKVANCLNLQVIKILQHKNIAAKQSYAKRKNKAMK